MRSTRKPRKQASALRKASILSLRVVRSARACSCEVPKTAEASFCTPKYFASGFKVCRECIGLPMRSGTEVKPNTAEASFCTPKTKSNKRAEVRWGWIPARPYGPVRGCPSEHCVPTSFRTPKSHCSTEISSDILSISFVFPYIDLSEVCPRGAV